MKKLLNSYQVINSNLILHNIILKKVKEVLLGLIEFSLKVQIFLFLVIQFMIQIDQQYFLIIGNLKRPVYLKGKISADEIDYEKLNNLFNYK